MKGRYMEIGLIGFGQFGQFFVQHLKEKAKIFVADKIDKSTEAEKLGVKFVSINEAAAKELVILAVPMSSFENTLKEIIGLVKEGSTVLDVCSLKVFSCNLMSRLLPKTVDIIGAHLLFGPQSGRLGVAGLKIALCPVRASVASLNKIKNIFRNLGVKIIETTPEEHDRCMAISHGLMHFITLPLIRMGVKDQEIKISALDKALELVDIFKDDSEQLFKDVQSLNPYARRLRKRFIKELQEIDSKLK